jgi:hypothetical protein
MAKLGKQTIAQTFKFNCDRYLRFELASNEEREQIGIDNIELGKMRPGVQLMIEAANKWEADKYQDLIDSVGSAAILYDLEAKVNTRIGIKPFKNITNIFKYLSEKYPPYAIIEGIFEVPDSVSPSFKIARDEFGIQLTKANPDVIWIRPFSSGSPLIRTTDTDPEFELHIIDVKMASEASLKHFTEVTFYAFALAEAIKEQGLDNRYQVSAKGLIWPGSHDNNKFRNLYNGFKARGDVDPVLSALNNTLEEVPYEVYEIHVRKFLDERFLDVLRKKPFDTSWHVSSKCQLCQYLGFCEEQAKESDHLCRIAWLNQGQADLIRQKGINTTAELFDGIFADSVEWQTIKSENHQLKADQLALKARTKAIQTNEPEIIKERKCGLMPDWVDMSIFLTIHFDPGTGLTFAMGAKRVYFNSGRQKGDGTIVNEQIFIIDKVDSLNPDTEKNRLIEFIDLITSWFMEADTANTRISNERHERHERDSDFGKMKVHVFFWNQLEVKQLLRMIERHMTDSKVVDRVELLIRLFPPDSILPPDAEAFKSQPGTVVKDVVRQLVGLPLSHDYTLLEAASTFFPYLKSDGAPFIYYATYGFRTDLNDQIPFERAYELWKDDVFLKHSKKKDGSEFTDDEKRRGTNRYTRGEILEGLTRTVKTHLNAIQHIVNKLREKCGDQLTLKKAGFSAAPPSQIRVPEVARQLITFQKLDAITHEIENRHQISLPIDEKEARFISIRGLLPTKEDIYQTTIEEIRLANPNLVGSDLRAFTFSPSSKDARIKEGDFLCAIYNEESNIQMDILWYKYLGKNFNEGRELMINSGFTQQWDFSKKIRDFLQVTVIKLYTSEDTPFIIIQIKNTSLFQFAIDNGIINLSLPMVLDPLFKDFESDELENVLRLIGGKSSIRTNR